MRPKGEMELAVATHAIPPGLTIGLRRNERPSEVPLHERYVMPAWMEILINVIGYAGFIAIATYHKSSGEKLPDR